jgi:hypothetical protein
MLACLALLSILMTYPLVKNLGSQVLGPPAPGDNFEYVHKVWWFKHALFDLGVSPFHDPSMFYPDGFSLFLAETTLANIIPALPLTVLVGEVAAYNLTMLVSCILSALGMYLLVLYFTRSRGAGLLSGVIFAFCPYRMAHLGAGHLPLMATQWLPLFFLYLERMVARRRLRDACMAALFYALAALSAWYYAYVFGLAAAAYVLLRARPWGKNLMRLDLLRAFLVFGLICLLAIGPIALPVTQLWKEGARPQSLRYLDQFSTSPLDFVYPSVMHPLWGTQLARAYAQNPAENILYLGLLPMALAIAAIWLRREPRRERRVGVPPSTDGGTEYRAGSETAFAWLTAIFAILAMGISLHWRGGTLRIPVPAQVERLFTIGMNFLTQRLALFPISSYSLRAEGTIYLPLPTLLLYLYFPFFGAMRVWSRLGLVPAFGVAVLAGCGWHKLCHGLGRPANRRFQRAGVLTAVAVCLAVLEFATFPFALGSSRVQTQAVDRWLAQQPGDFAVMVYPTTKAIGGLSVYRVLTLARKRSTFGQSTYFPRSFTEQRALLETFPSEACLRLLKGWGVRYVLIAARSYGQAWAPLSAQLEQSTGLRFVAIFDEEPIYYGDRLLHLLPGKEPAFIVDQFYVYEVL